MKSKQGMEDKQTTDVEQTEFAIENKCSNNLSICLQQNGAWPARDLTSVYVYIYIYMYTYCTCIYPYVARQFNCMCTKSRVHKRSVCCWSLRSKKDHFTPTMVINRSICVLVLAILLKVYTCTHAQYQSWVYVYVSSYVYPKFVVGLYISIWYWHQSLLAKQRSVLFVRGIAIVLEIQMP